MEILTEQLNQLMECKVNLNSLLIALNEIRGDLRKIGITLGAILFVQVISVWVTALRK